MIFGIDITILIIIAALITFVLWKIFKTAFIRPLMFISIVGLAALAYYYITY